MDAPPAYGTDPRTKFLDGLASGLSVAGAAREAGVHRATPYGWREADPEFAQAWDVAREAGTDLLEDEAWRRAYDGTERPVYQQGGLVGKTREHSDLLLIFLLKGRRPEKYRDNSKVELTGNVTLTALVQEAAQKRLERARVLELKAEPA
jgi:hypothetical protein